MARIMKYIRVFDIPGQEREVERILNNENCSVSIMRPYVSKGTASIMLHMDWEQKGQPLDDEELNLPREITSKVGCFMTSNPLIADQVNDIINDPRCEVIEKKELPGTLEKASVMLLYMYWKERNNLFVPEDIENEDKF